MRRFARLMSTVRLALAAMAVAVLAQVFLAHIAFAQQQAPMVGIDPLRATLTEIETAARRGGLSMRTIADLTQQLTPVRDDLRAKVADLEPRIAEIDARLDKIGTAAAVALRGRAAIANARLAYQAFQEVFAGPRFAALKGEAAAIQKPLWASTSTKDPSLPDLYYAEALVAASSGNTVAVQPGRLARSRADAIFFGG